MNEIDRTVNRLLSGINLEEFGDQPTPQPGYQHGGPGNGGRTAVGAGFDGDGGGAPPGRPTAINPEDPAFQGAKDFEDVWKTPIPDQVLESLRERRVVTSSETYSLLVRGETDSRYDPVRDKFIVGWIKPQMDRLLAAKTKLDSTTTFKEFLTTVVYLAFANGLAPNSIYAINNFEVNTRLRRIGMFAPGISLLPYEKQALEWHDRREESNQRPIPGFIVHDPVDFRERFRSSIFTRYGERV